MRVGLALRTWAEKGGIGGYTRHLVYNLLTIDTENDYVVFYKDRELLGTLAQYKNVTEVHISTKKKLIWDHISLPAYARREKLDIVFHPKLAVPLLCSCKTVMVLHGSERFVYPQFSHKSDILYFKTIYPFYFKKASAIISVSENARKDVINYLKTDPNKVKTIPLAVADHFKVIEDRELLESVKIKYDLPEYFIFNVGLLYPGKNTANLLRAFRKVREKIDVKLVLGGIARRMFEGDLRLINELDLKEHVILPGYIDQNDLPAVYNLAAAVAFPSYYESFPVIPLEANACGCPVVTSSTGGTPESAGDAAIYINPDNVEEIARAVINVLEDNDLRRDIIDKGFKNIKRFSWRRTAEETRELFESLG